MRAEPIAPGNSRPACAFDASRLIDRFVCAQAFPSAAVPELSRSAQGLIPCLSSS
jgi:hypothetical protein